MSINYYKVDKTAIMLRLCSTSVPLESCRVAMVCYFLVFYWKFCMYSIYDHLCMSQQLPYSRPQDKNVSYNTVYRILPNESISFHNLSFVRIYFAFTSFEISLLRSDVSRYMILILITVLNSFLKLFSEFKLCKTNQRKKSELFFLLVTKTLFKIELHSRIADNKNHR